MNNKQGYIAAAILILVSFSAANALPFFGSGDRSRGHGRMDPEKRLEEMVDHLDLTKEQEASAKDILSNYESKLSVEREKMAPLHKELQKMLLEENVNLGKVREQLNKISAVGTEIHMLHIQQNLEIEKILNETQKKKLRKFKEKRLERRKDHGPRGW